MLRLVNPVRVSASAHQGGHGPEYAFDRNFHSYWNGLEAPAWIEADFGREVRLRMLWLLVEQTPDGASRHEFYLGRSCRKSDGPEYRLEAMLEGFTANGCWLRIEWPNPQWSRYLKIRSVQSCSWVAWREIMVFVED